MVRRVTGKASSKPDKSVEPDARNGEPPAREARSGSARQTRSHGRGHKGSRRTQGTSSVPGEFVDARGLASEDLIDKTLKETSSPLGVIARPKVIDISSRLHERKRARIRAIAGRIAAAVSCVAVIGLLAWVAFFSPAFRLEESGITVVGGNDWVSKARILSIATTQSGKSLFLVSSGDVVGALEDIPGVVNATVTKKLPNRLVVQVKARRPAAMLKDSHGTLTAVDSKGRVLNSVKGASVKGIPVIGVDNVTTALKRDAVKQALSILSALPESMRTRVSSVTAKTQDSVTTVLDSGTYTVVWGDSSDMTLKIAVVTKLLEDKSAMSGYSTINVSAPERPIVK
ncbi:FtsQ-type POTRA domain-containing protein [uncultured Bifidobacterium sp.]|uniref:cell division protein FtsQ/DivIB n=1 Tax=uncultured Bifidobacterium sp. TaxID=165187 RepID=UPI0026021C99|nr:FtsQ-type POTRA domain-containing protein [uncultured Bifidobacterium sp.]